MVKKIFEVKENRVSVVNIVLAMLSFVSIFIGYVFMTVIVENGGITNIRLSADRAAALLTDIVFLIGSPICIIIRNLKLKSVRKLIWHTFLEYAIAFAVSIVLVVVYALII